MVTDQEIAKGVETLLRQSDPNAVTSLNDVVQQLEATLGLDLSHKAGFIRDQISFLLRSEPVPKDQLTPEFHPQYPNSSQSPQQFLSPHVVFQQQLHQQHHPSAPPVQPQVKPRQPPPPPLTVPTTGNDAQNVVASASATPKGSTPTGTKRRGGPGGLNKVCGVSPELQAIVGEPALPRTEIVKQLWAYIRKHNLQDPSNKRKIICDDALRVVFETDCTDMFKMNKLLAKHITALDPTKEPGQAKKQKVEDCAEKESTESSPPLVLISDSLLKFFGSGEREMLQAEVLGRIWEYIKANQLEDPSNSTAIRCDAKLQELLGCKSISALGIQEIIARRHLFKR